MDTTAWTIIVAEGTAILGMAGFIRLLYRNLQS